jgi:membrane protein required for colicin V production
LLIGWLDRGLGIGLALVKGIIISYLLIVLLTFFMPSKSPLIAKSKAAHVVIVTYQSMSRLISPDLYKTWKKRIYKESEKVGKIISEGTEAVKKIPQVLPDKKE